MRPDLALVTGIITLMTSRRLAVAASLVPFGFGVLGSVAWKTGVLRLASLHPDYIPMAPSTSILFILLSAALIVVAFGGGVPARRAVRAAALVVGAIALLMLVEFFLGMTALNLDTILVPTPGAFGVVQLARMSPVTAATFLFGSVAVMCLTGAPTTEARDVGGVLGGLVALVGATVVLGYVYGAPLLYGGRVIPVALTAGLSLIGTGVALVALAGPSGLPLRPFFAGAARASVAETLNRELEDSSRFALAAAGAGVWEVDLVTGKAHWSAEVGPMFGLPAQPFETTMDGFRARVHPDDLSVVNASIARSIHTDAPYLVDYRVPQPDASVRWISAKGRVLRADDGTPVRMLGIAIDVSDRKHLEQQLQQAQKMELMGQLAGGIAHDFNNVLAAILGFGTLLISEFDPGDRRADDVAEIMKAGESGRQLARQLLAFSRQQPLEPTALDLNAVVQTSESILKQLLGLAVRLELRLQEALGAVWADAGQMQQILVNLAVNARDAMPKGGQFLIETSTLNRRDQSDAIQPDVLTRPQVVLAVTDTGTGMSPETTARIFEPFFTTKAADKGTGLGLSTVYGIVRQSGGVIEVTSTVGEGTTFRIYLPLLD